MSSLTISLSHLSVLHHSHTVAILTHNVTDNWCNNESAILNHCRLLTRVIHVSVAQSEEEVLTAPIILCKVMLFQLNWKWMHSVVWRGLMAPMILCKVKLFSWKAVGWQKKYEKLTQIWKKTNILRLLVKDVAQHLETF